MLSFKVVLSNISPGFLKVFQSFTLDTGCSFSVQSYTWPFSEEQKAANIQGRALESPSRSLENIPEDYLKKLVDIGFRLCWRVKMLTLNINAQAH